MTNAYAWTHPATVLVVAFGKQERIKTFDGRPKHFLPCGDELILRRTIRLLSHAGVRVGWCGPHEWQTGWLQGLETENRTTAWASSARPMARNIVECGYPGEQVVLLGDVVWSIAALCRVLEPVPKRERPVFYGREGANLYTGKGYGELYAVRCKPSELEPHQEINRLWLLKDATGGELVEINDWTDDIDTQQDAAVRLPILSEYVRADGFS